MSKTTAFQQVKAKELLNTGWVQKSCEHHHTGRDGVATYMYCFVSAGGRLCYLAPSYIQYI